MSEFWKNQFYIKISKFIQCGIKICGKLAIKYLCWNLKTLDNSAVDGSQNDILKCEKWVLNKNFEIHPMWN